jgi:hypothetical protein
LDSARRRVLESLSVLADLGVLATVFLMREFSAEFSSSNFISPDSLHLLPAESGLTHCHLYNEIAVQLGGKVLESFDNFHRKFEQILFNLPGFLSFSFGLGV